MSPRWLVLQVSTPEGPPALAVTPLPAELGRDPACALHLDDPLVSGRHAQLRVEGETLVIEDLGSANGLWRGEERVHLGPWPTGQALRLGRSTLTPLMLLEERARVLRVAPLSGGAPRRQVVRLPSGAAASDAGPLELGPKVRGGVLAELDEELTLLMLEGERLVERRADEEGLLDVFGRSVEVVQARAPANLPTDLVFAEDGEVLRAQSAPAPSAAFPPPCFDAPVVDPAALEAEGLPVHSCELLALGGGLGSFCWVDALRVHGVSAERIRVVGFERTPYARYARLCRNSQIPEHERLRSNSESCPDNYWGFPGYGAREAWSAFWSLSPFRSLSVLWTLVAEPDHAATYTPKAGEVFASVDAEAERIGWAQMLEPGRIRAIRKTSDGRYAVAVSSRQDPDEPRAVYLASTLHLALGYPGVRFLPDLREYRERTRDFERVVNAYEDHDALYRALAERGGTVVLRGRGIVASRVLQRLYELRQAGATIDVVHLMRGENTEGTRYGAARREVEHHWEFQPFNWPEACWGGDLKRDLADASPAERAQLLHTWGGTTTADRKDWRRIIRAGLKRGWYRVVIAEVRDIQGDDEGLLLELGGPDGESTLRCDGIIDATGLVSGSQADPVLADLIDTYGLELNAQGRLEVEPSFEVRGLRNGGGRLFAAGVCTLGSHYAPVDSFLGLQFSASASLDALPSVPRLSSGRSLRAWGRWMRGEAP